MDTEGGKGKRQHLYFPQSVASQKEEEEMNSMTANEGDKGNPQFQCTWAKFIFLFFFLEYFTSVAKLVIFCNLFLLSD